MINILKAFALTGGYWVIYLLIVCSVVAVAVMIERGVLLFRERKEIGNVRTLFAEVIASGKFREKADEFRQFSGLVGKVISAGLSQISEGIHTVEEKMISVTFQEKQRLETRLMILGTLGSNAVYVGLFGTVLGVIQAFHDLAQEGSAGPEVVMQGLSEALIATAVGLLVAIPCVVAYNFFQKEVEDLLSETETMTHLLLARLKCPPKS